MRTAFSKSGPKKSFQSAPNKNAERRYTVDVAQLVRVTDCGSEGRGFEPHLPPLESLAIQSRDFFFIFSPIAFRTQSRIRGTKNATVDTFFNNSPTRRKTPVYKCGFLSQ